MDKTKSANGRRFPWWPAAAPETNLIFSALTGYRYLSWLLTSTFYLLTGSGQHPVFQGGVVCSLFLAALVTHRLHRNYWGQTRPMIGILVLETAAILALLMPTGGLGSVFIWYAINPILAAATTLSPRWTLGVLIGFLGAAHGVSTVLGEVVSAGRAGETGLLGWPLPGAALTGGDRWNITLIFVLVTMAAQVLAGLVRQTELQNTRLRLKGLELQQALHVRGTLYRLIEGLSTLEDRGAVADQLAAASLDLLKARRVRVEIEGCPGSDRGEGVTGSTGEPDLTVPLAAHDKHYGRISAWLQETDASRDTDGNRDRDASRDTDGDRDRDASRDTDGDGDAAPEARDRAAEPGWDHASARQSLQRVGDLAVAALERLRLMDLNRLLIISAEKNRIAAELHDSVAQQLFSIGAASHILQRRWDKLTEDEAVTKLQTITATARQATRSLRASIYDLSAASRGGGPLHEAMGQYLRQLGRLHGIETSLEAVGDEHDISPELRTALFRVLQEASGNAIGHGRCRHLKVRLRMDRHQCRLLVADDGGGFEPPAHRTGSNGQVAAPPGLGGAGLSETGPSETGMGGTGLGGAGLGMGLRNMEALCHRFSGCLQVRSRRGRGTVVRCRLSTVPASLPPEAGDRSMKLEVMMP